MRYNPAAITDIGQVVCPPYDAMDSATIETMLRSHPRNIARLILPRLVREPPASVDPYLAAAHRLTRWREQGSLITDPQRGLYVYEYGDSDHRVCGLVGALELSKHNRRMILPHEDVDPAVVEDRLAMVAAARANLEPILLLYDGDGGANDAIAAARATEPLMEVTPIDGSVHRVWSITDPATLGAIKAHLKTHQALIADGHHRYATYRQLRRYHRAVGDRSGPWERGLALLIDQSAFPLILGAIHRSVAEMDLAAMRLPSGYRSETPVPLNGASPQAPQTSGQIVLTDGVVQQVVHVPDAGSEATTDISRLHDDLLPAWGVAEERLGFHHSVSQATQHAVQEGGVAVLLYPSTMQQVMSVARAGKVMPKKSTSFAPKPHIGLIMRSFDDE
jgi:uncharacterized protein (DUF1015 family)